MPRPVKAYGCSWKCGRRPSTSYEGTLAHEKTCFMNPFRRACKTCRFEAIYLDWERPGPQDFRFCAHENENELGEHNIKWDCPDWLPKVGVSLEKDDD